ncbi:MAG: hypothetical protein B6D61_08035 [Bacteroidetes bacterium 4484_249]|nr:MAG: hypothetical protein B6D61_08035 [Bacteroidetes bacterium 4484_249]
MLTGYRPIPYGFDVSQNSGFYAPGARGGYYTADGMYHDNDDIARERAEYYLRHIEQKEEGDFNNITLDSYDPYAWVETTGMMYEHDTPPTTEEKEGSEGYQLKPLYGWSIDFTLALPVGWTIEFGEIYDPNTGKTYQFISNGPAFGVEATAGLNAIYIIPKENFKISDLEGTSWGMSASGYKGILSASVSGNSTPGDSGGTQFDSYYMIKVGIGPGAGFNNTPKSNTNFIDWIPSRLWWD